MATEETRIDLNKSQFDQLTYMGRARHFFFTTNPINAFASNSQLERAKMLVTRYRDHGDSLAQLQVNSDELWQAKTLYDSAYHPDTGEKMLLFGRMSFQVPGNMGITGSMLTFYRSTPAVVFWQWVNQTFNAAVNYTNRSGASPISSQRLGISYALATTGAVGTALLVNRQVQNLSPLVGRFVPFVAVAAANCINIPCMRSQELSEGISIVDENGNHLGQSVTVARWAIAQVVFSRMCMAVPGMVIPPLVMDQLERRVWFKPYAWTAAPLQILLCGFCLTFATPLSCALFPQMSSMAFSSLEPELRAKIEKDGNAPERIYYNKGL